MSHPRKLDAARWTRASVMEAFAGLIVGEKLGEGCFRDVWTHATDPSLVVKIEHAGTGRFCNVDEYNLWDDLKDEKEIAKWLAPVRFISACGTVMLQDRTQPITRIPAKIQNFFADTKVANWGRLKGRPVMHDFGNTKIITGAIKRFKLVDRP